MNITHDGKLCLFNKDNNQRQDIFYDKCWFIAKTSTDDLNTKLADIYINMKYLGCRYNKNIENKIKLK